MTIIPPSARHDLTDDEWGLLEPLLPAPLTAGQALYLERTPFGQRYLLFVSAPVAPGVTLPSATDRDGGSITCVPALMPRVYGHQSIHACWPMPSVRESCRGKSASIRPPHVGMFMALARGKSARCATLATPLITALAVHVAGGLQNSMSTVMPTVE